MSKLNGESYNPIYKAYRRMINRCYYKKTCHYDIYGGRGIIVCDEWKNDYFSFKKWAIENGYKIGLSLDRIDTNGNYEPSNCRWITMEEQANNKRNNLFYTINGETKTQAQWCRYYNIPVTNVRRRLSSGWSIEEALTIPVKKWR